jgi:hypothetical protein
MENNEAIICDKCNKGKITAKKHCRLRWLVSCDSCDNKQLLYYPQLMAYIKVITYGKVF